MRTWLFVFSACVLSLLSVAGCRAKAVSLVPPPEPRAESPLAAEADIGSDLDQSAAEQTSVAEYFVGYGDVLSLHVIDHAEYDLQLKVPPHEVISLPRLQTYSLRNKSLSQIQSELTDLLGMHLRQPQVTVNVIDFAPLKVVVLGEVVQAGVFPYTTDLTLGEALGRANGLKDSAHREQIVLLAPKQAPRTISVAEDWYRNLQMTLAPNSVVIVPNRPISAVNVFVDQFFARMQPVLDLTLRILDVKNYDEVYRVRE